MPPHLQPKWLVIAGAFLLYAAGRVAARAIHPDHPAPGRRAIGHWLPIAAVVLAAMIFGQPDMALAVAFSTTVASLALVGGCVAMMGAEPSEPQIWPAPARSSAALFLAAAVVVFLVGFAGRFSAFNCAVLLTQGAILAFIWLDGKTPAPFFPRGLHVTSLLATLILSVAGAWLALKGALGMSADIDFPPALVPAAAVLSPLLVASMLLSGADLAQHGKSWAAHATHIGLAQLNLCLLLPLAALTWRLRWHATLSFPLARWRIDAVILILLAVALLPAAAGRWRPQRLEGLFNILLYVAYVLAVIGVAVR